MLLFQALACLLNPPTPFITDWGQSEGKHLAQDTWDTLQTVTGRDLWLGYDNGGWETTGDEYGRYKLTGDGWEVWLFYSATRDEYDILPFSNPEPFADANGDHYGMHPCGGWAVDAAIFDALIGDG